MTEQTNQAACPLCLQTNGCDVAAKQGCWCNDLPVPQELLNLLPEALKNKSCICRQCIVSFNENPSLFLKK
ncbi:cysteine-rich CWC family protein [Psychromonas sp. SA13A]|uniref:cysteine-rich CWC family protein n=1 Tax=Psychromonas sp. SA13A TaxID=2686346 RepID=UPI00140821DF|nr:cysteine-rich CWC family protein [Psychromonas sp. SA13A]